MGEGLLSSRVLKGRHGCTEVVGIKGKDSWLKGREDEGRLLQGTGLRWCK